MRGIEKLKRDFLVERVYLIRSVRQDDVRHHVMLQKPDTVVQAEKVLKGWENKSSRIREELDEKVRVCANLAREAALFGTKDEADSALDRLRKLKL